MGNKKRKGIIPAFEVVEICEREDPLAREVKIEVNGETHTYHVRPLQEGLEYHSFRTPHCYNKYPVVLDPTGVPWDEGNISLLDNAEMAITGDTRGLQNMADDLTDYCHFLDTEEIDPYKFPTLKNARPTYRYRSHLLAKAKRGEVSVTIAKRRINAVVAMYRNLKSNYGLIFENAPWKEKTSYIPTKGERSDEVKRIRINHTDLTIPKSIRKNSTEGYIIDGERLKPLSPEEQTVLIKILLSKGNLVMCLIFFLGMFSGARIQTISTLKARFFDAPSLSSGRQEIPVGPGTGNDTKYDKARVLRVSAWLYNKIHVYVKSPEWERRRRLYEKKHGVDTGGPAVFYTTKGNLFYEPREWHEKYHPEVEESSRKDGAAVRDFISKIVRPQMRAHFGEQFHIKFHNTRATFGYNFIVTLRGQKDAKWTETQLLEMLADELWQEDISVTKRYLVHDPNQQHRRATQLEYEVEIELLAQRGMQKLYDD